MKIVLALLLMLGAVASSFAILRTWTGNVSTSWHTSGNWSPSGIPAAGDDVTVPSSAPRMPSFFSGTTNLNSLTVDGTLTVSGGTLTVAVDSTVENLNLAGGTIGGTGAWTILNDMNWTQGSVMGSGDLVIPGGSTLDISGSNTKTLNQRRILNSGVATWTGTGDISALNSPQFVNTFSGDWNINTDGNWVGGGVVTNQRFVSGANTFRGEIVVSTLGPNIGAQFNNAGRLDLINGAGMQLSGGGTSSGIFNLVGANFTFQQGDFVLTSASTIQGTSPIQVLSGNVTIEGVYNMTSAASPSLTIGQANLTFAPSATLASLGTAVYINAGNLTLTSGEFVSISALTMAGVNSLVTGSDRLRVTGLTTWELGKFGGSGVLEIPATGDLNIIGAFPKQLLGTRVIEVTGDVFWTGSGNIEAEAGTRFDIMPNGDFFINTSGDITGAGTLNVLGDVLEGQFGEVIKMNTTIDTTEVSMVYNCAGLTNVQSGVGLTLQNGGSNSGHFEVAGNLTLGGGAHTFAASSRIAGAGFVVCTAGAVHFNGTLNIANPGGGPALSCTGGVFNFLAPSTIQALGQRVFIEGGVLNFSCGEIVTLPVLMLVSGTLTGSDHVRVSTSFDWAGGIMRGSGRTEILSSGIFRIQGATVKSMMDARVLEIESDTQWTGTGNVVCSAGNQTINRGQFTISTDADWLGGQFENIRTVRKAVGSSGTQFSSVFTNRSEVYASANTLLQFAGGYTQSSGLSLTDLGEYATLQGSSAITITNGTLQTFAGNYSSINANVVIDSSELKVGRIDNAGILFLDGDLSLDIGANLRISAEGTDNGDVNSPQYGQIVVTGDGRTINLGQSALRVDQVAGYNPRVCDEFDVILLRGNDSRIEDEFRIVVAVNFVNVRLIPIYRSDKVVIRIVPLRAGDVNADGCVDDTDLSSVLTAFGQSASCLPEDLDGNGIVDDTDLAIVLGAFGFGC